MFNNIIQLNEQVIKIELKALVRNSVEKTLNELLNAFKYERSEKRNGYRAGHYTRGLRTTSGDVTLKVPKLKGMKFETAVIERYHRRECSVEEAFIEMYLAGVSVAV